MRRAYRLVLFTVLALIAGPAIRAQHFDWAVPLGDAIHSEGVSDVSLDAVGNFYLTGSFADAMDFDPGPDAFALGATSQDVYVAKYTKDAGLFWAVRFGGAPPDARAWPAAVSVDAAGNVYSVGQFEGTVDFDPGVGVANLTATAGLTESWVAKLDSAGGLVWARRIAGATFQFAQRVRVDAEGNVYTAGHFTGTADFDPGPGTFPLTSSVGTYATYVQKLDAAGSFVWAKALMGPDGIYAYALALAPGGDLVLAGYLNGTADFDPGPGVFNLSSAGQADAYVARLSAAGSFVWARVFGGPATDDAFGAAVDADGDIFVTGRFQGTVDLDPSAGVSNSTSGGTHDVFVSKFEGDGSFAWARQLGGASSNYEFPAGVAVDAAGNPHVAGSFIGTADFDPGAGTFTLTSTAGGEEDVFAAALDGDGAFLWAAQMGGACQASCSGGADRVAALAVDPAGHTYTTGIFRGQADFDPSPSFTYLLTSQGLNDDMFISKLSPVPLSGATPDGGATPGAMLTLSKVTGGNLRFQWGPSCRTQDTHYAVYEGTLGNFSSHVPMICNVLGTITIRTPAAGDRYYLIVPNTQSVEGSFGLDGNGNERAASLAGCFPQSFGRCVP